jgi:thiol-disulfide isomerase/thioredoxin
MPRNLLLAVLSLIVAFSFVLLMWVWALEEPEPKEPLPSPPNFSFQTLDGQSSQLMDFWGKPIILHFWATWCQPCVVEFPQLIAAARKHPEVQILAISVDSKKEKITKFLSPYILPKNLRVVWDKKRAITYDLFQSMNYPESILIGCDFTMQGKVIGMAEDWEKIAGKLVAGCAAPSN